MNRDFKGVWIPRHIWCDAKLNWSQKLMLVEIDSLDNQDNCFASNAYFAKFFGLSTSRVSAIIGELEKGGYVISQRIYKGKQCIKRLIRVTEKVTKLGVDEVVSLQDRGILFPGGGYPENSEDNNTTNKNNNKGKKKEKVFKVPTLDLVEAFKVQINAECSPKKFIDYHTSKGWVVGRSPMKDWEAAFRTWEGNHHEFKKEKETNDAKRNSARSPGNKYLDLNAAF